MTAKSIFKLIKNGLFLFFKMVTVIVSFIMYTANKCNHILSMLLSIRWRCVHRKKHTFTHSQAELQHSGQTHEDRVFC